jgi:hypothetical protein
MRARREREKEREREKRFPDRFPNFPPTGNEKASFFFEARTIERVCERVVKRTRRPTIVVNDAVVFLASIIMMSFLSF